MSGAEKIIEVALASPIEIIVSPAMSGVYPNKFSNMMGCSVTKPNKQPQKIANNTVQILKL